MGKGKAMLSSQDPEAVKLATEEAIAAGKVGRMVVQLKQELMHHVKHKQFEEARTACERILMLAPRDKMTLECLLLIEQKIELDEIPSNDEDAAEEGEEESEESEEEEEEEESSSSSSESEDEEDEEEVDIVTNGVKKLMANGNGASH